MPDISQITLPSGTTYDIKDTVARNAISGGVTFIIAWDGTSAPVVANIPAGVTVTYNGTTYTGTKTADSAQAGAFYLVKSTTSPSSETVDIYDEYVPIGATGSKTWEKIGDTQLNLSDVVTGVTLSKGTTTVLGTGTTLTVTQPSTTLNTSASSGTGKANISRITGLTKKHLSASASGGAVSASGDNVTALTGLGTPTTASVMKAKATANYSSLATTTVTGVSGSTTASKVTAGTSQTTATGAGTASSSNTDWLKGVSVSGEVLTIGAATMNTQTTTQFTASNVTVPIAASSATTVATGGLNSGQTAGIVTSASVESASVLTGLGTPTTDTVLGTGSTFSVTNPTVTLSSGTTGDVEVVTDGTSVTAYLSATTSGADVTINADSKTVVTDAGTTITVTKG